MPRARARLQRRRCRRLQHLGGTLYEIDLHFNIFRTSNRLSESFYIDCDALENDIVLYGHQQHLLIGKGQQSESSNQNTKHKTYRPQYPTP